MGPTAVVSLLTQAQLSLFYDPVTQPQEYLALSYTATFYAGLIQLGMGLLRWAGWLDLPAYP